MILTIFLYGFAIMLLSLVGILFLGRFARKWLESNLALLLTFSAGVFFITAFDLVREAFALLSSAAAAISVVGGYLLFLILQRAIPESHHHHDQDDCDTDHSHGSAIRILIGDGIHNIGDGILLVPAFMVSTSLGIATAISIFAHEFLQEVSEFFVLRGAGYSTKKALGLNFLVSSTILIGIGLGLALSNLLDIQGILLGVAAGGFLYIVFHDLILHRSSEMSHSTFLEHLMIFLLGVLAIMAINMNFAHSHGEGDGHDHGHEVHGSHEAGHNEEEHHDHYNEEHGHDH